MKHLLITLFLNVMMTSQSWSQDTWVKTFGGQSDDWGQSITTTPDGGLLIAGCFGSPTGDFKGLHKGGWDIFIMRLDTNGNVLWKKTIGGRSDDWISYITTTSDGNVLITGYTESNDGDFEGVSKGGSDIFVIKLDMNGELLWRKSFGGSGDESAHSICTSRENDILITGETYSNDGDFEGMNKGEFDIVAIKLDRSGELLWKKTFGGTCHDRGLSINNGSDGVTQITGSTCSNDGEFTGMYKGGGSDIFVIKLDMNGELLWRKTFGGSGAEEGNFITTSSIGGVVITGWTRSRDGDFEGLNMGTCEIFVIDLYMNGTIHHKRTLGGTGDDYAKSLVNTQDGGLILTGFTTSNDGEFKGMNKGRVDVLVIKLDSNRSTIWKNTFGGKQDDFGWSMSLGTKNETHIVGRTSSSDGDFKGWVQLRGGHDIFVMKLDSNGNLNPSTSVTDYTSITPSLLVTPNPITTSSTVMFSTGTPTTVRIELLNTLGESVTVLHDGFMESGEHRVPLGVSSVSSGVYYVRMTSEGTVNSTQVVVLK